MRFRFHRTFPHRERVFACSLLYHGYRLTHRRKNLKKRKGYVIPATGREDSSGIDFWVKAPGSLIMQPVQITQRGVAIFRQRNKSHTPEQLQEFIERSNKRLSRKRAMCRLNKIAFVLVRDYTAHNTNRTIAWGDIKALRYALDRV